MRRTLQEIIDHQDEIAAQFENYEPDPADQRDVADVKDSLPTMNLSPPSR